MPFEGALLRHWREPWGKAACSAPGILHPTSPRAATAVVSLFPKLSKKPPAQDKPLQPVLGTSCQDSSNPVWATEVQVIVFYLMPVLNWRGNGNLKFMIGF